MPIKIGKSKLSGGGSELIHTNSFPNDSSNNNKKNRGLRRLFERGKCSPSSKVSFNENNAASKSPQYDSSPKTQSTNVLQSASPNLYTNSCTSSIEELSKMALNLNTINSGVSSTAVPCTPIQDVILEEDYEEALLVTNKTLPSRQNESNTISKGTNVQPVIASTVKFSQGIYNEPKDAAKGTTKEVIESCRLSQITPTNQFKEIRSRSGSDTDPLIAHPDHVGGGRCSTNSSSIGSAQTLSESPAVIAQSCSPQNQSVLSQNVPSDTMAVPLSSTSLSININSTSLQTTSGPPTMYTNSPKGNTVICHHPSSPFAPPAAKASLSTSSTSTCVGSVANQSHSSDGLSSPKIVVESPDRKLSDSNKNISSNSNIVSRRPGRFGKSNPNEPLQLSNKPLADVSVSQEVQHPMRNSEKRSEYLTKHPVYEEAWDLKLKRICKDMVEQSGRSSQYGTEKIQESYSFINSGLPSAANSILNSFNRPQSVSDNWRRSDSPNTQYTAPPVVPPHRRNSMHYNKLTHGLSFEDQKLCNDSLSNNFQTSQSTNDCRTMNFFTEESVARELAFKPNLKHNINPIFDDKGLTTDYDYAYNETWSLGVQFNMAFNLTNNDSMGLNVSKKDSFSTTNPLTTGYMDKIDSVDSEESSSLSTSQEVSNDSCKEKSAHTTKKDSMTNTNSAAAVDNDSLSNDSYDEPWDVRHGRVISELTSTRLIDPACVLTVQDQPINSPRGSVPSPSVHHKMGGCHHNRSSNHHQSESKSHGSISSGNYSKRQRSVSASRRLIANSSVIANSIINKSINLEDQPWYHDSCTRQQAEQMLAGAKEGSFLVRKSETSRNDFSLSIKHNNDFLHMKISKNQRGFILGQYSQPYVTIPHMLHHYSLTMVPVKGADAVLIKTPIMR